MVSDTPILAITDRLRALRRFAEIALGAMAGRGRAWHRPGRPPLELPDAEAVAWTVGQPSLEPDPPSRR